METIHFRITGTAPLLMNKDTLADPLHALTKEHKALTIKKKKTDEDHEAISRSEWKACLYWDDEIGIYISAEAVEAVMRNAAKRQRMGQTFRTAVLVLESKIPLVYDGPKDWRELIKDPRFVDRRPIKQRNVRVLKTRPRFDKWGFEVTVMYDPELINKREVISALEQGGRICGLLDWRPRYGQFEVEVIPNGRVK